MEASTRQKGMFSWNELMAKDVEAATGFYTRLFGWTSEFMPAPEGGGDYTVFKVNDTQVAGMMRLPAEAEQAGARPYWGAYVTVDDVEATARKAQELGANILVPPMEVANVGTFCTIQDPQGAIISFIQYS